MPIRGVASIKSRHLVLAGYFDEQLGRFSAFCVGLNDGLGIFVSCVVCRFLEPAQIQRLEIFNGLEKTLPELHCRLPFQMLPSSGDIRTPLLWIVFGKWLINDFAA